MEVPPNRDENDEKAEECDEDDDGGGTCNSNDSKVGGGEETWAERSGDGVDGGDEYGVDRRDEAGE